VPQIIRHRSPEVRTFALGHLRRVGLDSRRKRQERDDPRRGVRFTCPGNRVETLRGLGFDVGPGEIFGFLGPSGAGKSTTQKILIGLLRGFSGSVRVRGRSLTDYGTEYYESIGVSFELPSVAEGSTGLSWAASATSLVYSSASIAVLYRRFRRQVVAG
jgi:ABC-type multidrug transport system ATPase subunit